MRRAAFVMAWFLAMVMSTIMAANAFLLRPASVVAPSGTMITSVSLGANSETSVVGTFYEPSQAGQVVGALSCSPCTNGPVTYALSTASSCSGSASTNNANYQISGSNLEVLTDPGGSGVNTTSGAALTWSVCVSASGSGYSNTAYLPLALTSTMGKVVAASGGRYLVDHNGNPFMLIADSAWTLDGSLPLYDSQGSCTNCSAAYYFKERAAEGFNAIQFSLLCSSVYLSACPSSEGSDYAGNVSFPDLIPECVGSEPDCRDFAEPNSTYFARVESLVSMAASFGLATIITDIDTGNCTGNSWMETMINNGSTNDAGFGEYLGTTFKSYPNIIWMFGNDYPCWTTVATDDYSYVFEQSILAEDTVHLHTMEVGEATQEYTSLDDTSHSWSSVISLNGVYSYAPVYNSIGDTGIETNPGLQYAYNQSTVPAILLEANYYSENNALQECGGTDPPSPQQCQDELLRKQFWWTMTAGGVGQVYGNHCVYFFLSSGTNCSSGWTGAGGLTEDGETQQGYGVSFLKQLPWWSLVPDLSNTFLTAVSGDLTLTQSNAYSYMSISNYPTAALASTAAGTYGVVYVPATGTGASVTINMADLGSSIVAEWYDPTTSNTYNTSTGCTAASPCSNTGTKSFTIPGANAEGASTTYGYDWVLLLTGNAIVGQSEERFYNDINNSGTNWTNVTSASGCSAIISGSTNAVSCIQNAINSLSSTNPVLYFPAGVYQIDPPQTTGSAASGCASGETYTIVTVASGAGIVNGMELWTTGNYFNDNDPDPPNSPSAATQVISGGGTTTLHVTPCTEVAIPSSTTLNFSISAYDLLYVTLIGNSPSSTIWCWAGPSGGKIFAVDGTAYSRFDRMTFQAIGDASHGNCGGGSEVAAKYAVDQSWVGSSGNADTYNQYADDVFENAGIGFNCGNFGNECSEVSLLRDQFLDNSIAGEMLWNFNALDIWTWYSTFQGNAIGIANYSTAGCGAGNAHAFDNVFLGSTISDINLCNAGNFDFYGNYSSGSNQFLSSVIGGNSAGITGINNTVVNTTLCKSINGYALPGNSPGDLGPYVFIDNDFQLSTSCSGPIVYDPGGDTLAYDNTYNVASLATPCGSAAPVYTSTGRCHEISDTIATVSTSQPSLPGVPPAFANTITEATSASAIATAISTAASTCPSACGAVHIQAGNYSIGTTLTIPANDAIAIFGDGGDTILTWTGSSGGTVFSCGGTSGSGNVCKATFAELEINDNSDSTGIQVNNADQSGARVYMEQPDLRTGGTDLYANGLNYTSVEAHGFQYGPASVNAININGGGADGGAVKIFLGATGAGGDFVTSGSGNLESFGIWYDAASGGGTADIFTGSGSVTLAGSVTQQPGSLTAATVQVNNFSGTAAFIEQAFGLTGNGGTGYLPFSVTGTGGNWLAVGMNGPNGSPPGQSYWSDTTSPADTYQFVDGQSQYDPPSGQGAGQVAESCKSGGSTTTPCPSAAFLATTLNQVINTTPIVFITPTSTGVTDVQIYRVLINNSSPYAISVNH